MSHESFLSVFFITFLISGAYLRGGHGGMAPPTPIQNFEKKCYTFEMKLLILETKILIFLDKTGYFETRIVIFQTK